MVATASQTRSCSAERRRWATRSGSDRPRRWNRSSRMSRAKTIAATPPTRRRTFETTAPYSSRLHNAYLVLNYRDQSRPITRSAIEGLYISSLLWLLFWVWTFASSCFPCHFYANSSTLICLVHLLSVLIPPKLAGLWPAGGWVVSPILYIMFFFFSSLVHGRYKCTWLCLCISFLFLYVGKCMW